MAKPGAGVSVIHGPDQVAKILGPKEAEPSRVSARASQLSVKLGPVTTVDGSCSATTLLLLVSAFAGTEVIDSGYQTALEQDYRFYSLGDAMLLYAAPTTVQ